MLTTFYFDQELFSDESLNLSITNNIILEIWLKYGCLAVCRGNEHKIIEEIKKIPIKYRQKWVVALSSSNYKKIEVDISKPLLSTLEGIEEFKKLFYTKNIVTGVLITEYQELFANKSLSIENACLEILTPTNITESINFNISKQISEKDIKAGETFSNIWKYRFDGLAKHTSIITILDRYMALNMESDSQEGSKTSLERLIETLSAYGKKFTIDIYSACDIPSKSVNASSIKYFLDNVLKKKPYFSEKNIEIKFSLCKNKIFTTEAHDRMMCFDNHVVQIGKGMDIFRDKPIDNNVFTIKSISSTFFKDTHRELTRNREWVYL